MADWATTLAENIAHCQVRRCFPDTRLLSLSPLMFGPTTLTFLLAQGPALEYLFAG
jgi:hypothetical protein